MLSSDAEVPVCLLLRSALLRCCKTHVLTAVCTRFWLRHSLRCIHTSFGQALTIAWCGCAEYGSWKGGCCAQPSGRRLRPRCAAACEAQAPPAALSQEVCLHYTPSSHELSIESINRKGECPGRVVPENVGSDVSLQHAQHVLSQQLGQAPQEQCAGSECAALLHGHLTLHL